MSNIKYNKKFIYGTKYLNKIKNKIKKKILKLKKIKKKIPLIIIINIGNNKSSKIYIKNKIKTFKYIGIKYKIYNFKKDIKENKLIKKIKKFNYNKNIDCILIQLPLPKNLNTNKIINTINPYKDVDGLHYYNLGKLSQGNPYITPCTSKAIIKLLNIYNINIVGINILIIGKSNLVGKPINMVLINKGCTVTIINSRTKNIKKYIKNADIIISAIGKYNILPIKSVKKNSIIIDVGININKNYKIQGDINYKLILNKIKYISPVPGGVGPMTIAYLIKNIMLIYKNKNKNIN